MTEKTLIIYVHPATPGHCPVILEETVANLKELNQQFEILDLYKMNYDPVLHENEHYTAGGYEISEVNKKIQEKIKQSKHLIFIYPIWWNSMPAMLKGFLDKVFTGRYAFKYVPTKIPFLGGAIPRPLLKGKKAVCFVTTGSKKYLTFIFLGNRFKKIMANDILPFMGIKTKLYQLDEAKTFVEEKRPKIKKMVKKGLTWLY